MQMNLWLLSLLLAAVACGSEGSSESSPAGNTELDPPLGPSFFPEPNSNSNPASGFEPDLAPDPAPDSDPDLGPDPAPDPAPDSDPNLGPDPAPDPDAGGDNAPGIAPTITNLTIEPNPLNVLSAFVSWTTDQPASSEVQFGVGGFAFRIRDDALVTDHRTLVIGMRAQSDYLIKAVSSNGGGSGQAEGSFTTGALPVYVPQGTLLVNNTERSQPGWTLMNVQVGDGNVGAMSNFPATVVMYDHDGYPVWYFQNGTTNDRGGAVSVDLLDNGNILIGPAAAEPPREVDLAGNIIWEGPNPLGAGGAGALTHHVGKLSNGHYLIQRDVRSSGMSGVTGVQLEELTAQNEVVWTWNLFDFLTPPPTAPRDWCHGNYSTIDIERDEVYVSCRWLGLIKTTYINPTYQWHMAATYNGENMGDVAFNPLASRFTDIHCPEIHDDGTISFFDNGGWNGSINPAPAGTYRSRVLEFAVDQVGKQATLVWEFPGNFDVDPWFREEFYLPWWGDADRLDNGNVLITAGVRGPGSTSHVFEVTKEQGEVVWDFTLPDDHGVYRAERIPTPPLVEPLD